jgi:hypothetical protein
LLHELARDILVPLQVITTLWQCWDKRGQLIARLPGGELLLDAGAGRVALMLPNPTQRDLYLQLIAERGRLAGQKAAGYNRRAPVEADISRDKRVIGNAPRSHGRPAGH